MTDVFRALGDPTRRALLDRLDERNGQTLTELCQGLGMARQSVTQHLGILEDANLVAVVRSGRERLHYLNPYATERMCDAGSARPDALTSISGLDTWAGIRIGSLLFLVASMQEDGSQGIDLINLRPVPPGDLRTAGRPSPQVVRRGQERYR